jgi:hypothetical protein
MEQLNLNLVEQTSPHAHAWQELAKTHQGVLIEILARLIARASAITEHEEPSDD